MCPMSMAEGTLEFVMTKNLKNLDLKISSTVQYGRKSAYLTLTSTSDA